MRTVAWFLFAGALGMWQFVLDALIDGRDAAGDAAKEGK